MLILLFAFLIISEHQMILNLLACSNVHFGPGFEYKKPSHNAECLQNFMANTMTLEASKMTMLENDP